MTSEKDFSVVYRDILGRPDARASVISFGIGIISDGYYMLTAASDAPEMRWGKNAVAGNIASDLDKAGWDCSIGKDGHGNIRMSCSHRNTQAIIDAKRNVESAIQIR